MKQFIFIAMAAVVALALTACAAGKDGAQGPQGITGNDGIPGVTGPQGPAGADGTQISVVQFCPNDVPTYPTTFPEVGLLINGSIYAVYSTPGAFLTLIPPGLYTSAAVGSSCNFTVNADGTVTPQ